MYSLLDTLVRIMFAMQIDSDNYKIVLFYIEPNFTSTQEVGDVMLPFNIISEHSSLILFTKTCVVLIFNKIVLLYIEPNFTSTQEVGDVMLPFNIITQFVDFIY